MNILFSCDEYPPAKTGGIGSATKTVAEALAGRGHNVYVVSGRLDKALPEEAVINGVIVYRLYMLQEVAWLFQSNRLVNYLHTLVLQKGWLSKRAIREYQRKQDFMEQIIRKKHIDVVEVTDYTVLSKYYTFARELLFRRFSVLTVARVHGSISFLRYYRDGKIHPATRANDKRFFESADKILSVSQFAAGFVNNELGIANKCDVIYNPLVSTFVDLAKGLNTKREKNIVFLGKVIRTKGAFNLIDAFSKFSIRFPDYKLIMIGGMIDESKSHVPDYAKDKVLFTGYLQAPDIARYLKSAAFCVIPTFFENFSVAALEVMGCENILIYTITASGPEVIEDGVDGFLVDPHDVDAIADKMAYVADNLRDLEPMRKVAAQKVKDNFSEKVIIDKLEKYYSNLMDKVWD